LANTVRSALRDAALIVVSILIAFALDAWWEGQSWAAEEREALTALQQELSGSRTELDSVMEFNQSQVESIDQILDPATPAASLVDTDTTLLRAFSGGMTFDPSLSAVEAILAGGLDRISSPELRTAIAAWPGVLREIEVDQRIMVDRFNELSDALVTQRLHIEVSRARLGNQGSISPDLQARVIGNVIIRQRLSALRTGVDGLLYELSDVEARLEGLETMVNGAIGNR
jgi:hypothetical protein